MDNKITEVKMGPTTIAFIDSDGRNDLDVLKAVNKTMQEAIKNRNNQTPDNKPIQIAICGAGNESDALNTLREKIKHIVHNDIAVPVLMLSDSLKKMGESAAFSTKCMEKFSELCELQYSVDASFACERRVPKKPNQRKLRKRRR